MEVFKLDFSDMLTKNHCALGLIICASGLEKPHQETSKNVEEFIKTLISSNIL